MSIQPNRIIIEDDGEQEVIALWELRPGAALVRGEGKLAWWTINVSAGVLSLTRDGKVMQLRRAAPETGPPALRTFEIPPPEDAVDPRRVEAVKAELQRRFEEDKHATESDQVSVAEALRIRRSNTEWLKGVLGELGWIAAETFGSRTTFHAFIVIQHSDDLSLLRASMPYIEKEFREGDYAQSFALLRDRLSIRLGLPQKYGTQITMDEEGPLLYPLEDPSRVNQWLAELGLPPLEEYLSGAEKFFAGEEIRRWEERRLPPLPNQ